MDLDSNEKEACRLCLRGDGKISVFEIEPKTGTATAENVFNCVSVKITKDDKLPTGICENCLQSVSSWCTFKNICDQTQEILQGWLVQDTIDDKVTSEDALADIESCYNSYKTQDETGSSPSKSDGPSQSTSPLPWFSSSVDQELDMDFRPDDKKNFVEDEESNASEPLPNDVLEQENLPSTSNQHIGTLTSNSNEHIETLPSNLNEHIETLPSNLNEHIETVPSNLNEHLENLPSNSNEHIETLPSNSNEHLETPPQISLDDMVNISDDLLVDRSDSATTQKLECMDIYAPIVNSEEPMAARNVEDDKFCKYISEDTVNTPDPDISQSSNVGSMSDDKLDALLDISKDSDSFIMTNESVKSTVGASDEVKNKLRDCLENEDSSSVEILTDVKLEKENFLEATVMDNENSLLSSCLSENSKTDISITKIGEASPICEDDNSNSNTKTIDVSSVCEEDSVVEFSTAVTIDVNPFPDNDGHECLESFQTAVDSSKPDPIKQIEPDFTALPLESDKLELPSESSTAVPPLEAVEPEVVSSSISPPAEKVDEKEGEVSSSVEKQLSTPPQESRDERFEESQENRTTTTTTEMTTDRLENDLSLPLVVQIKEEPIDSTTEDAPLEPIQVRVKSEFANFNFESNELVEPQMWSSRENWQSLGNPEDPNNTQCFICKRTYSSVGNYRAHLQTKMHLFNSGQLVELPPGPIPKEPLNELSNPFESPLLRSRLSSDPLNHPSYAEPPSPPLPLPPQKRKCIDHCSLCNVSFVSPADLRRHLYSKRHRFNERLSQRYKTTSLQSALKPTPSQPPMQFPPGPSPTALGSPKSIFICPIQNCNFSCSKGESLLFHMQVHGIAQPFEKQEKLSPPTQKLSLRQQDLLKKEAELKMKKEVEIKLKREAEMKKREAELKMRREAEFRMKREAELKMKRETELKIKRETEMMMRRGVEMKQLRVDQQELMMRQQIQGSTARGAKYQCDGCQKHFVRESGLKKHSWYCSALTGNLKQELLGGDELGEHLEEEDEDEVDEDEEQLLGLNEDSGDSESHCPLCDISFTNRNTFINHIQIYHKGSYLESSLAKSSPIPKKAPQRLPIRPIGKTSLIQNPNKIRVTNKTHGFCCDICGKKFNLLSSLNFHLKTHTVSVKHICRICKEPFTNRKSFIEHCRQHFLKPGSKETLCHKCFKVFKTRSELYQHRKNDQCAIKMKIYSCNSCEHSFKEQEALEEHKVRFHSESLDMPDDEQDPTYSELYEDGDMPLNPLCLLSEPNENLPGTSSRISSGYLNHSVSFNKKTLPSNAIKLGSTNATNFNTSNSPNRSSPSLQSSSAEQTLHCNVCNIKFSSKQTLRKHTLMFHIYNKPYSGSKKYNTPRKGGILQANLLKQWKCKHCKQSFRTRKVLVHHLKKCELNSFEDLKGICLQCGKWCESGKTRICQECLPDVVKAPGFREKQFCNQMRMDQSTSQSAQLSKNIKQEFESSQFQGNIDQDYIGHQIHNPVQSHFLQIQKVSENIKKEPIERKEIQKPKVPKHPENIDDIVLMKCPIGNKYFRNEMIMVKHYSECDGSCENRCSHCRKLFPSPKDYKLHLVYSKCFGPRRNSKKKPKLKYPTFACKKKKVRKDPLINLKSRLPDIDMLQKPSDDFSDNTMDNSVYSEDNSSFGIEPSSSINPLNKIAEEKSLKLGRICRLCNKVIHMQRAIYRHVYDCCKSLLHTQDYVSCTLCEKTFTKHVPNKDNATALKQHVLSCHFIPYYVGQGIDENGTRLETPPQFLCYVCSFGFSSNECLTLHIKEHRTKKDEINTIVLQLEEELLSDERLVDEKSMYSLHINDIKPTEAGAFRTGRVLTLQDPEKAMAQPSTYNIYPCDTCPRKFYNKKKYLRHRMVHRIVSKNVYNEMKSFVNLGQDDALSNDE